MNDRSCNNIYPRPGYQGDYEDAAGGDASEAWTNFDGRPRYRMEDGTEIY